MIPPKEQSFFFNHVSIAPDEQIGIHQQPSWELSYIILGSGVRLIGDTTESFQCGEVVLIPPEIPHCWFFKNEDIDPNGKISNITITFTDEFISHCSSAFPELRQHIEQLKKIHSAVRFEEQNTDLIVSTLTSMCSQNDVERLASMIKLLAIISSTDNAYIVGTHKNITKEQEKLNKIHTYVICNATRDVSLNDVVRHVGMNKSAFCIFFKRATGKTFITYLNEYRVELACQLLIKGNMSVTEIGYHVGFTNVSYFNRTFKKMKGCSPTKYRHKS